MPKWMLALVIGLGLLTSALQAQVPIYRLTLKDSSTVDVFANPRVGPHQYFYLPTKLRLATQSNGDPQFSFLAYSPDDNEEVSGAIMHLLVLWGLSFEEEQQATVNLRSRYDSLGVVSGAAMVEPDSGKAYGIWAKGDGRLADLLNKSLTNAGSVPNSPGAKWAASFRFADAEAREMQKAMVQPSNFKQVNLSFYFQVQGLGKYELCRNFSQLIPAKK